MLHRAFLTLSLGLALPWSLAGTAIAERPELSVSKADSTLTIAADDQPVLGYRYQEGPFKPYVKELFTPQGVQILRDSPADHVHHHGLMFAIFADGVDFWSERDMSGKQLHVKLEIDEPASEGDAATAGFVQQLAWTPPKKDEPLLRERRSLTAHQADDVEATLLTWCTRLTPADGAKAVKLTGTHYDGLGMRFVESMDQVGTFQYASGEPGPVVRGTERLTRTKWCAYTAPADGKPVTVALFGHPQNARHPAGMFSMLRSFAYLSATPNIWKQPLELAPGESLDLRYGVAVWDGQVDREEIEGLYEKWLALQSREPQPEAEADTGRPNVLLVCVDDLRPQLGCYGCVQMHTPNIDRLAAEGRKFTRHYVQVAACGPSRCSMLTGRRIVDSWDCWTEDRRLESEPEVPVSFAHLFRRHGYRTVSIGKVSHEPGGTMPPEYQVHQVPFSWDVATAPAGQWKNPWRAFFAYAGGAAYNRVISWVKKEPPRLPLEAADVPDDGYPDALIAQAGIQQLRDLTSRGGPFLLAVGFFKPHLPHNAPKKYWDLYDADEIGLASNPAPPKGIDPAISLHQSYELTAHYHWPGGRGNISPDEANRQRHAYFACVSYVDAQIGKLLDEYRRLGLEENTVVVLWSDHGWHLGEHGIFCKATNFEVATRSPLLIRVPGMPQPGEPADGLVETVDLYPTLAELCNLSPPAGLAGTSLVPMVTDSSHPGKEAAHSYYRHGPLEGNAVRTDRYRLVRWTNRKTGEVAQTELYDHRVDPQENCNVAAANPEVVKQLLGHLE